MLAGTYSLVTRNFENKFFEKTLFEAELEGQGPKDIIFENFFEILIAYF